MNHENDKILKILFDPIIKKFKNNMNFGEIFYNFNTCLYPILPKEKIVNTNLIKSCEIIEVNSIIGAEICFLFNQDNYLNLLKSTTINIFRKYYDIHIFDNSICKLKISINNAYKLLNLLSTYNSKNINDYLLNINLLQNNTSHDKYLFDNLITLEQNQDIIFNINFRFNIPLEPLALAFNVDLNTSSLKHFTESYNPYSSSFVINNDYFIEDTNFDGFLNQELLNKFKFKNHYSKKIKGSMNKKKMPAKNNFTKFSKLQILYSLDYVIDKKNNSCLKNILLKEDITGLLKTLLHPIFAIIRHYKNYDNYILQNSFDLIKEITNDLKINNPEITFREYLDYYYNITLSNDFLRFYPGKLTIFDSNNIDMFEENLEKVLDHLLDMNQNSETIDDIIFNNTDFFSEMLTNDSYINNFINKQLELYNPLIIFLCDKILNYPDSLGKEILNLLASF